MKRGLARPGSRMAGGAATALALRAFFAFFFFRRCVVSSASAREGVIHSALPITRRSRLQLSSVRYLKSLNRRAGLPVATLASAAAARSAAISTFSREFCARPNKNSTSLVSHQAISSSRAKPESARRMMRTFGHGRDRRPSARRAGGALLPRLREKAHDNILYHAV